MIVLIALPLIPVFMVLIGLTTADRSAAALTAMATLQSRLLDLVAGLPTLRALLASHDTALRAAADARERLHIRLAGGPSTRSCDGTPVSW